MDLNADDIRAIVREAVREELHAVGLRVEEADHQDEARDDFRFLRRFRKSVEGGVARVGWAVITIAVGGLAALLWAGLRISIEK